MSAGEAPVKQAATWLDDQLRDHPQADRITLVDEASRRFDLSPLDADFLYRHLAARGRRRERSGMEGDPLQTSPITRGAQFGPSAAEYVASSGHAGGRTSRPSWRGVARCDPAACSTWPPAAATPRSPSRRSRSGSWPTTSRRPCWRRPGDSLAARGATNVTLRRRRRGGAALRSRPSTWSPAASPPTTSRTWAPRCARWRSALRPGGSLLLQDILGHDDSAAAAFILEVERRRDPSHVRSYRAVEWKALLRGAGLTPMEETVVSRSSRPWEEWTGRMRMTAPARADLDRFVREAPAACREAFAFRLTPRTAWSPSPTACSCSAPTGTVRWRGPGPPKPPEKMEEAWAPCNLPIRAGCYTRRVRVSAGRRWWRPSRRGRAGRRRSGPGGVGPGGTGPIARWAPIPRPWIRRTSRKPRAWASCR